MKTSSRPLTVAGHLEELRKRIIFTLVLFLAVFLGLVCLPSFTGSYGAGLMNFISKFLLGSLLKEQGMSLVFLDPLEPVFTVLKLSFIVSLLAISPVLFYQVYAYIRPAFKKQTGGYLIWLLSGAALFLALGLVFSFYFLVPVSFKILVQYGLSTGAQPVLSMGKFFDMFIWMILLFSLPFELPAVIGVLSRSGLISAKMLVKARKAVYLGMAVFSAIITPDPTPVSMLLLWVMLVILFEFGVFLARMFERGKK